MRILFFMVLIAVLGSSCKKNTTPELEIEFVKGDVLLIVDSFVHLEQLFSYINSYNLKIDQLGSVLSTTTITKDSIPYIINILNSKTYINTRGFSASVWAHYQTNVVHNTTILWDMNIANQQDYIQTKNLLRMTEDLNRKKYVILKVPVGDEIYWKDLLITLPWVNWTGLNRIDTLEFLGG